MMPTRFHIQMTVDTLLTEEQLTSLLIRVGNEKIRGLIRLSMTEGSPSYRNASATKKVGEILRYCEKPQTQPKISNHIGVSQASISKTCARAVQEGLMERTFSPELKRLVWTTTALGLEVAGK